MALESILDSLTNPQSINALSSATGKDAVDVSNVLAAALPTLLGSLQVNADKESQANSLAKALSDHGKKNTGDVMNNLETEDGEKILGHLLGNNTDALCKGVSKSTGLNKKTVLLILCAAAPLLMNIMGKNSDSQNTGSSGNLGGLLGNLLGVSSNNSGSELQEINNISNNNSGSGVDLGAMASMVSAMLGTGNSNTNSSANLAASLLGLGNNSSHSNNSDSNAGATLAGALLSNVLGGNSNSNNSNGLNLNTMASIAGSLLGASGGKTAAYSSGKKTGSKTGTKKKVSSASNRSTVIKASSTVKTSSAKKTSSSARKGRKIGTKVSGKTK